MTRNSEASRKKILEVAVRIFAGKGFDGARVDEIAREAQVNKALIYYYFKSKSLILEEIFKVFHQETSDLILSFLSEQIELKNADWINSFFNTFVDYLETQKDTLKIMITESLKTNDSPPPIFGFMELMFQQETESIIQSMKEQGYTISDQKEQIMVSEFFTDIIPIISFIVFKDKWSRHFKIDKQKLKELFFEAHKSTHVAYHLSQPTVQSPK